MRTNYPLSSKRLNDAFMGAYAHYVYLLGYDNENGATTYSGLYDVQEEGAKDTHPYISLDNKNVPPNDIVDKSIPEYIDSIAYKESLRSI
jgi:hypothetical protein